MFSPAFRTRTRKYGIEYEYHFIEYEYDKSPNSATSKNMSEHRQGELFPSGLARASTMSFELALFACFGVSIDVFPDFSYSYSALAVLVLVLENTASSTSTIKAQIAQLQKP